MSGNGAEYAIEIKNLVRRYGKLDAVNGLCLNVRPGRVHGFLGRNGAGKSTTIKCLLNHLRPTSGEVRVFGIDPRKDEVAVKAMIGYVPEVVAFYPWMTIRGTLEYAASFRKHWNKDLEMDLLRRFELEETKKIKALSKGMRSQVGLICAVCPDPDLLLLDEPTSGLDPIVRREFIETVIGAYQEAAPDRRTVFVSTHLINEFEGLIDEFTIINHGKAMMTLESDAAREKFKKIKLVFASDPPEIKEEGWVVLRRSERELDLLTHSYSEKDHANIRAYSPESVIIEHLTLEEIFVAIGKSKGNMS